MAGGNGSDKTVTRYKIGEDGKSQKISETKVGRGDREREERGVVDEARDIRSRRSGRERRDDKENERPPRHVSTRSEVRSEEAPDPRLARDRPYNKERDNPDYQSGSRPRRHRQSQNNEEAAPRPYYEDVLAKKYGNPQSTKSTRPSEFNESKPRREQTRPQDFSDVLRHQAAERDQRHTSERPQTPEYDSLTSSDYSSYSSNLDLSNIDVNKYSTIGNAGESYEAAQYGQREAKTDSSKEIPFGKQPGEYLQITPTGAAGYEVLNDGTTASHARNLAGDTRSSLKTTSGTTFSDHKSGKTGDRTFVAKNKDFATTNVFSSTGRHKKTQGRVTKTTLDADFEKGTVGARYGENPEQPRAYINTTENAGETRFGGTPGDNVTYRFTDTRKSGTEISGMTVKAKNLTVGGDKGRGVRGTYTRDDPNKPVAAADFKSTDEWKVQANIFGTPVELSRKPGQKTELNFPLPEEMNQGNTTYLGDNFRNSNDSESDEAPRVRSSQRIEPDVTPVRSSRRIEREREPDTAPVRNSRRIEYSSESDDTRRERRDERRRRRNQRD